jgi:APA family basic amino acid/polyamine antiporter
VIYVLFGMTGITLFIFRARGMRASYRVWGYPVVPIAFILMSFAFAVNAFIEQPKESLLGVAVASIGFPLYLLSERLTRRSRPTA